MNVSKDSGRTERSGKRTRKSRHTSGASRAMMISVLAVILLIPVAIGVRLFNHVSAGEPVVEPRQTQAPAEIQTQPSEPADTATVPPESGDTTPPQIMGVNKLSVFLGSTVAYRSGILVTDDMDPAPKLSVDSSQVDLSRPGTYPVIYAAADSTGNTTSVETTITVAEAPDTYVDETIIKETADQLLEQILTDGMTKKQQINAIYDWIESHCYYIANFDKSDYMQAAYLMMTDNRGDCFGFYAVSRLLFDRLGLPNLTVTRVKNLVRTSNHWWNMVSLDGGETWYHFDATPHMTYPTRTCLVTDAALEEFNELMPYYYCYDHSSYPKTPTE